MLAEIEKAGDAATEAWLADPDGPVRKRLAAAIAKLGENMAVPRFVRYAGTGYVGQYIHMGGKIGVQVEFGGCTPEIGGREELTTLVKEIAMQIAAASPAYVSREAVPADVLEKERAIYRAQMENSGKPANVLDKIVEGKLGSFYKQVVLPDQESIRDPKMTVKDVLAAANKALGSSLDDHAVRAAEGRRSCAVDDVQGARMDVQGCWLCAPEPDPAILPSTP